MGWRDSWNRMVDSVSGNHDEYDDEYMDDDEEYEDDRVNYRTPSAAAPVQQSKAYRMIVVEPYTFGDSEKIADHLKSYRPVVINLEKTEDEVGRRLIDFVSGVTYALEGHIEQVSNAIFLAVPNNMTVDTENYTYTTTPNLGADVAPTWGSRQQ